MLKNEVVLITGAGRGIGRAIALAMAQQGARVAVNSFTGSNAEAVADEIKQMGGESLPVPGDVSRSNEVKAILDKTVHRFGTIDILINNVGIGTPKPILELEEHEWERIIDVNLKSYFLCGKEAAKIMKEKGRGVIINVSSVAGLGGRPDRSAYCTSKAGVNLLTQCMACEWTKFGIRVNAIAPGITRTDRTVTKPRDEKAKFDRRTLIGRWASPEEVARVAVFLASDDASYIVGATIPVDGGWTAYSFV